MIDNVLENQDAVGWLVVLYSAADVRGCDPGRRGTAVQAEGRIEMSTNDRWPSQRVTGLPESLRNRPLPDDAPMSVNGSDDVFVFNLREFMEWCSGLLCADKTGRGHSGWRAGSY
jgi:hypothetical protein